MGYWSRKDIGHILEQLDARGLPFKRYTFTRKNDGSLICLGSGGSGIVFEARRRARTGHGEKTEDAGRYAIKVIGFKRQIRPEDAPKFENALRIQEDSRDIYHDVVRVYGRCMLLVMTGSGDNTSITGTKFINGDETEADGTYPGSVAENAIILFFVVMEKLQPVLSGGWENTKLYPQTLGRKEGGIWKTDEREIMRLAEDIGGALQRAHDENIIHNDIKLENIFYDPKLKRYKLGDFGIAAQTETGFEEAVHGTNGYLAPEARRGKSYDRTADIYSFGITLYVLAEGLRFPNSDSYKPDINIQYMSGYEIPEPSDCSQELASLIVGMCRYDPDRRFQSMDDVMEQLNGIVYKKRQSFEKKYRSSLKASAMVFWIMAVCAACLTWPYSFLAGSRAYLYLPSSAVSFFLNTFLVLAIIRSIIWELYYMPGNARRGAGRFMSTTVPYLITVLMTAIAAGFLITDGFSAWKIVLILLIIIAPRRQTSLSEFLAAAWLTWNITEIFFFRYYIYEYYELYRYTWIVLAAGMQAYTYWGKYIDADHAVTGKKGHRIIEATLYVIPVFYAICILVGLSAYRSGAYGWDAFRSRLYSEAMTETNAAVKLFKYAEGMDSLKAGIAGLAGFIFMEVYQSVIIRKERGRRQKISDTGAGFTGSAGRGIYNSQEQDG